MYFEWRDTETQQYSNYIPNNVPAVFFDIYIFYEFILVYFLSQELRRIYYFMTVLLC